MLNFLQAILIGLAASIPLGPLGIMCIQRTLDKGRWAGFAVGVGSSLGDVIYASIALFSVSTKKIGTQSAKHNISGKLGVFVIRASISGIEYPKM